MKGFRKYFVNYQDFGYWQVISIIIVIIIVIISIIFSGGTLEQPHSCGRNHPKTLLFPRDYIYYYKTSLEYWGNFYSRV